VVQYRNNTALLSHALTCVDIDRWHARDLIAPLFFNDSTDFHCLIRKRLVLPYLTGSFHPSFIVEYAGGLLMALQKQDGGLAPSSVGGWARPPGAAALPVSQ